MRQWSARILAVLPIVAFSLAARADRATSAREHFQQASAYFAVGQFAKAADEYQAAYLLKQDPALLYDAAQSFRLAGENEKALVLYRNYLQFFPNEPNADEVRTQIAKLQAAIAAQNRAKTSPPTTPAKPRQIGSAASSSPKVASIPAGAVPEAATQASAAPARKRRWWIAGVVAGAVVAVGLGVGLGVGLSSSAPPTPTLGMVGVQ